MNDIEDKTVQEGVSIDAIVYDGLGCPPSTGLIYPSSVTPNLTDTDPPGTGPEQNGQTWDQAPAAFGAVDPFPVTLTINVTGTSAAEATISGLDIHVLSRKPKVEGVWLNSANECGGGGNFTYGNYDLDAEYPYLQPASTLPQSEQPYALKFPYAVTQSDGEYFYLTIDSKTCECSWDAVLTWVDGTTNGSFVIDDNGQPFQDSSTAGLTNTTWSSNFASPSASWTAAQSNG